MSQKLSAKEIKTLQQKKIKANFNEKYPSELDKQACRGAVYNDNCDYKAAIVEFTQVLEQEPKHVFALDGRATAYLYSSDYKLALIDMNKAIKLYGDTSPRNLKRAAVLNKLDRYEEALKDANVVIGLGDKSSFVFSVRGTAHFKLDYLDEAAQDFSEAIKLWETKSCAYAHRSAVYYAYLYTCRSAVYLDLGNFDTAEADLKKALESHPKYQFAKQQLNKLEVVKKIQQKLIEKDLNFATRISEDEDNKSKDNYSSSSFSEDDEQNKEEPSAALTLQMIQALYEQQQEVAERQKQLAIKLAIVGCLVPGLSHLIIFIVYQALRSNDVVKREDQESQDPTYKKWTQVAEDKGEGKFDLYFYNDKAFKQAQALYREDHDVSEKAAESLFDSGVLS